MMLNLMDRQHREKANWSDLPDHILALAAIKLIDTKDYIRFGAVCRSWQCVYFENLSHYSPPTQLPLLMLTTTEHDDDKHIHSFYSLSERRVSTFRVPLLRNKSFSGSSHGWLLLMEKNAGAQLFNPFLLVNNKIELPLLGNRCVQHTAVLSANPASNPNFLVMGMFHHCINDDVQPLAIIRPGEKTSWTPVRKVINVGTIESAIYYDDQFYVVDRCGKLYACDVNHPHPKLLHVATTPRTLVELCAHKRYLVQKRYLVESRWNLLMVSREIDYRHGITTGFKVIRLESLGCKWVEVKSLDRQALFIGNNSSICLSSSDFAGCKPNCIYFMDDIHMLREFHDTGVFNMEDGTLERHYPVMSKTEFPSPCWILPTLQGRSG